MTSSRLVLALMLMGALLGMERGARGVGACCLADGCIEVADQAECIANGGEFFSDGFTCADGRCVGACCLANLDCVDGVTRAECVAMSGNFNGVQTFCLGLECGACLFADGTCIALFPLVCEQADSGGFGGIFFEGACPADVELACCFLSGAPECDVTTLRDCVLSNDEDGRGDCADTALVEIGFPRAYLTTCAADICVGACCLPAGCQEDTTHSECETVMGGTWLGPNTNCADHAPAGPCYVEIQHLTHTGSIPNPPFTLCADQFVEFLEGEDCDCGAAGLCECERELTAVLALLEQTVTGQFTAENLDPQNVLLTLTHQVRSAVAFPNTGTPIVDTDAFYEWMRFRAVGPAGGGLETAFFGDFVASAADNHALPGTAIGSFDANSGLIMGAGNLAPYIGPGTVEADVDLQNLFSLTGANDAQLTFNDISVAISLRVYYFYLPEGNITGRVWDDENCNGCDDVGEPGIEDVEVELLDVNGVPVNDPDITNPVFTDFFGNYCFGPLPDGIYTVRIDRANSGLDDYVFTLPNSDNCPDGATDNQDDSDFVPDQPRDEIGVTGPIEVLEGVCIEHVDAGFIQPEYRIYGAIYEDVDGDGCGDDPIPGVEVELVPPAGPSMFETTDANGEYEFNDLDNGSHTIRVDLGQAAIVDLDIVLQNCADPDFDNDLVEVFGNGECSFDLQFTEEDRDNECLVERKCNGVFGEFEVPEKCGCEGKGSVLYFHKVEIRWDSSGNVIQDTFLELSNDWPGDVDVQMYFINGDPPLEETEGERAHPGWNWVDNKIELTGNQPIYWSALNGAGSIESLSPFTVLDPGDPPGRPAVDGTPDRVLRGYIVAWAVNSLCEEIRWNHLSGKGTLVHFRDSLSWEYNACAFPAIFETIAGGIQVPAHGEETGTPGVINLDGAEFQAPPGSLLLQFQATMSQAWSIPGMMVNSDTDVTLHPASVDLRVDVPSAPIATKADYVVFNENEDKKSGAFRCVVCWDQTLLSQYGIPNHFSVGALGTDHGYARIDGIGSVLCPDSQHAAILGVAARYLMFDATYAGVEASSQELVGCDCEAAVIQYDTLEEPPPEQPFEPRSYRTADEFVEAISDHMN